MHKLLDFRFVRFLVVGVANTAFSYGVYASLLYLGLPYAWANLGALLVGIAFGFITQGRLVFGNKDNRLFGRYVFFWACIWVVNVLLIKVFIHLGLNAYWAGALALVPVVITSYLVQRLLVFRRHEHAP
jgi:putative flippase GtrA